MSWNEIEPKSGARAPRLWAVTLALVALLAPAAVTVANDDVTSDGSVTLGGQWVEIDADGDRDGRFEKYKDVPNGLVLDGLSWVVEDVEDVWAMEIWADDIAQDDQVFRIRTQLGPRVDLWFESWKSPLLYGDGARYVLEMPARDVHLFPDGLQQLWEDPNGDGTVDPGNGAYVGPSGLVVTDDDAALMPLVREQLALQDDFRVGVQRERNTLGLEWFALENWKWSLELSRETRDGSRPHGTGTYRRVNKPPAVPNNFDYWNVLRGIELLAPVDYVTDRVTLSTSGWTTRWFGSFVFDWTSFDNEYRSLTYDNPFFFEDRDAHGSSNLRGVSRMGRVALEPDHES